MTPVLKLACGGAAIWSLILVAATERDPPRPPSPIPDHLAALPKTDRLVGVDEMLAKVAPPPIHVPVVETEPGVSADLMQARARLRAAMVTPADPAHSAITNSQFAADNEPPARSAANGPPPGAAAPAADTDPDDLRPSQVRPRSASARQAGVNICTRYGMHKMLTNGGRSWRCRKGGMVKKPRTPRAKKPRTAEQKKHALLKQVTSARSNKTNIVGDEKARGRKPKPPTLPHADALRKIGIEGDEEGGDNGAKS